MLPLSLGVGFLIVSVIGLAFSWMHMGGENHPVSTRGRATLALNAGTYTVYRDAGDKCFNTRGTTVAVTGPAGRVEVSQSRGGTSVNDFVAQLFLNMGFGTKFPQAKLHVPSSGSYTVTILCAPTDYGAYVGPTAAAVVDEVRPWLIGMVVGTCMVVWGTIRRIRSRPAARPL